MGCHEQNTLKGYESGELYYTWQNLLTVKTATMNEKKIREIFKRFKKANPHPTTELIYRSPFELLIAVILSAQATDKSVNNATKTLYKVANTPEKILALGLTLLKKYISSIGLYNTKAKNIMATCKMLIEQYHSQVPNDRASLETLPGVGRKTANVILNTCFGQPTMAVDTHIFRVANRIGLAKGKTPLEVEKQLLQNIPKEFLQDAHHWLILHGRYVCVARKPKCPECLIKDLCEFPDKTV
jgi:endonuclease-3